MLRNLSPLKMSGMVSSFQLPSVVPSEVTVYAVITSSLLTVISIVEACVTMFVVVTWNITLVPSSASSNVVASPLIYSV